MDIIEMIDELISILEANPTLAKQIEISELESKVKEIEKL